MNTLIFSLKSLAATLAILVIAIVVTTPAHLSAKKPAKVDVCHMNGNGTYNLINISENAVAAHLAHGDGLPGETNDDGISFDENCVVVDPDPILAIVFIERDASGTNDRVYDQATDTLIARLIDSDGTPGLTAGDTLEMGGYPLDFSSDPAEGLFGVSIHTISFVIQDESFSKRFLVSGATSGEFSLSVSLTGSGAHEEYSEFIEHPDETFGEVILFDEHVQRNDIIITTTNSPSLPDQDVDESRVSNTDDGWLQVVILQ